MHTRIALQCTPACKRSNLPNIMHFFGVSKYSLICIILHYHVVYFDLEFLEAVLCFFSYYYTNIA